MKNKAENKVKGWYIRSFPDDELGAEIRSDIAFADIMTALESGEDFYNFIGVGDSIIRERIFEKMSEIYECDYDGIYRKWLDTAK